MTTYRFGLKKLPEIGQMKIGLKSKFGLKPLKRIIQEEEAPSPLFCSILIGCGTYGNTTISQRNSNGSLISISDVQSNWCFGIVMDEDYIYFIDSFSYQCSMRKLRRLDYVEVARVLPVNYYEFLSLCIDGDYLYSTYIIPGEGGSVAWLAKINKNTMEVVQIKDFGINYLGFGWDSNSTVIIGEYLYSIGYDENWVYNRIYKYNKNTLEFVSFYVFNGEFYSIAMEGISIWARGYDDDGNQIFKIDPTTMTIIGKGFNENVQTIYPWYYITVDAKYIYFSVAQDLLPLYGGLARTDKATLTAETILCSYEGDEYWWDGIFALKVEETLSFSLSPEYSEVLSGEEVIIYITNVNFCGKDIIWEIDLPPNITYNLLFKGNGMLKIIFYNFYTVDSVIIQAIIGDYIKTAEVIVSPKPE